MRKVSKIVFVTLLALFLAGTAFAINTSEGMVVMPVSEPAALAIFGSCLIALGAFSRRLLTAHEY